MNENESNKKWELTHETFIKEKIGQFDKWFDQITYEINRLRNDVILLESAIIELKDSIDLINTSKITQEEKYIEINNNQLDTSNALAKIKARLDSIKEKPIIEDEAKQKTILQHIKDMVKPDVKLKEDSTKRY